MGAQPWTLTQDFRSPKVNSCFLRSSFTAELLSLLCLFGFTSLFSLVIAWSLHLELRRDFRAILKAHSKRERDERAGIKVRPLKALRQQKQQGEFVALLY